MLELPDEFLRLWRELQKNVTSRHRVVFIEVRRLKGNSEMTGGDYGAGAATIVRDLRALHATSGGDRIVDREPRHFDKGEQNFLWSDERVLGTTTRR